MASIKDIAWVAGLLEGEGCFSRRKGQKGNYHSPTIQLCMTDKDTVIRFAKITGAYKVILQKHRTKANKKVFRCVIYGSRAVQWMQTIYPLMGSRRKQKLRECLFDWKNHSKSPYNKGVRKQTAEVVWFNPIQGIAA